MNSYTKQVILKDFKKSGQDLGTFALEWMKIYDSLCYELSLEDAKGKHGRLVGTAVMDSLDKIYDLISFYEITGVYKIRIVDTQKEFFCILAEIRDDLKK